MLRAQLVLDIEEGVAGIHPESYSRRT